MHQFSFILYRSSFIFFLSSFIFSARALADLTDEERLQGYTQRNDTTWFIYDEDVYEKARFVIIEGTMRNWNHDLRDDAWCLTYSGTDRAWLLKKYNPAYTVIPAGTMFKYRIDEGRWMNPPQGAPNIRDGNLVFAHTHKPLRIEAESVGPRDIRLIFREQKPLFDYRPENYVLTDHDGNRIPIVRVFYTAPGELQIVPEKPVNIKRVHYIRTPYLNKTVMITYDGWFRHLYSDKQLGANFYPEQNQTIIRLFAPRADCVTVYLFKNPSSNAHQTINMVADEDGVWEAALAGNWEGWYYDFTAHGPDEPGNHFYETNPVHFSDPWGRVSVDTFGPCRIWPRMEPATPLAEGIPRMEDVIAYEVHVQDFTRELPLPDSLKGTFCGFHVSGLTNRLGEKIGFDHLVNLGINVVHLMPVQEYLHFPDAEWQAAFKEDSYMIEQGIHLENYQWGYRTSHAFALENRYRVKGSDWGAQNRQFRDLVQAFHDHGIAVIVDVVFNHTAERMDNRQYYFNFSAIDVPYFYRTNERLDYLGEYGTETKSEERPMMQRWIIEQCTDLIDQYGIDGFRIDIAGQTDEQTLRALRKTIGDDKIVYGEPWIASADPDYENNPDWDWYKIDSPITFFQDDSRNAFKGPTSNPENKLTDRGYAGGNGDREAVKKALAAGFPEDKTPVSGINYLDIHDNWALADRFAMENWDGRFGVEEKAFKIAATLLFTSLGPVVIHGGTEFMRSKGLAPLKEIIKYTASGPIYIHGKRDSYNMALANAFLWDNIGRNTGDDPSVHCDYGKMQDFWKGLISLRKSSYGKVFRIADKPVADYYQWIEPDNVRLLGYMVGNQVLVLINTDLSAASFEDVCVPEGDWLLVGNIEQIDLLKGIRNDPQALLSGGQTYSIRLSQQSVKIWIKVEHGK